MQIVTPIQVNLSHIHNGCLWSDRASGKSHGLALQILENLHLKSIIVTSCAFRPAKIIHNLLSQICDKRGIKYSVKCSAYDVTMVIGNCTINFVPVNTLVHNGGDLLLVDEFQTIPRELWSVIVTHHNWKAVASI